jgi:hypothetical protein
LNENAALLWNIFCNSLSLADLKLSVIQHICILKEMQEVLRGTNVCLSEVAVSVLKNYDIRTNNCIIY